MKIKRKKDDATGTSDNVTIKLQNTKARLLAQATTKNKKKKAKYGLKSMTSKTKSTSSRYYPSKKHTNGGGTNYQKSIVKITPENSGRLSSWSENQIHTNPSPL